VKVVFFNTFAVSKVGKVVFLLKWAWFVQLNLRVLTGNATAVNVHGFTIPIKSAVEVCDRIGAKE
jgi:hypothetical protein